MSPGLSQSSYSSHHNILTLSGAASYLLIEKKKQLTVWKSLKINQNQIEEHKMHRSLGSSGQDNTARPSTVWRQRSRIGLHSSIAQEDPGQWCRWLGLPDSHDFVTAKAAGVTFKIQSRTREDASKLHFLLEGLTFPPLTLTSNSNYKWELRG